MRNLQEGRYWVLAPHNHSTRSDGAKSPQVERRIGREKGGILVLISDHDRITEEFEDEDLTWRAVETSSGEGHVLRIIPHDHPLEIIPMGLKLIDTVDRAQAQGEIVVIPHLNYLAAGGSVSDESLDKLYQKGRHVDGIEVKNPYYSKDHQVRAEAAAQKYNTARFGADDDHEGNPGSFAVTIFPNTTGTIIVDFKDALAEGAVDVIETRSPKSHLPIKARVLRHARALKDAHQKILAAPRFVSALLPIYGMQLNKRLVKVGLTRG